MPQDFEKLRISEELERDLLGFTDDPLVLYDFFVFVWGDDKGRPPRFSAVAETVWRVDGAGVPAPEVDVFFWGGSHLALPDLRIWFLRERDRPPYGFAAYEDEWRYPLPDYCPEREILEARVSRRLGARCWFERA